MPLPPGYYSDLVIAWSANFPTVGTILPTLNKGELAESWPVQPLYILREATQEEWLESMAERGYSARPKVGDRYFAVTTD